MSRPAIYVRVHNGLPATGRGGYVRVHNPPGLRPEPPPGRPENSSTRRPVTPAFAVSGVLKTGPERNLEPTPTEEPSMTPPK
jgi:hypothetical protein